VPPLFSAIEYVPQQKKPGLPKGYPSAARPSLACQKRHFPFPFQESFDLSKEQLIKLFESGF